MVDKMEEKDIAIQITGLKKRYRLGTIGGGTLVGDIQSWWARVRHKEDPNSKIGAKTYGKNETFMALDGVDLTVYKGERIGIIGHNGAGKSTLLKLLSRVTGPTEGEIKLDGRISSMLEVGTGFNGELTGRENVYLNGAILGMTKKEVDSKIEQIIDFSEVRQFIDTPVKRYSSGMYVKLAFSVAAHLDSEILIMDEVLAVGDMAFQNKCLNKMNQVSQEEGRTILYVSHNMNTIRQLCNRCIVMDHGKIKYDGDVDKGISLYMSTNEDNPLLSVDVSKVERPKNIINDIRLNKVEILNSESGIFERGDSIKIKLTWDSLADIDNINIRLVFRNSDNVVIASSFSDIIEHTQSKTQYSTAVTIDTILLAKGKYSIGICFCQIDQSNINTYHDIVAKAISFEISEYKLKRDYVLTWNTANWGNIHYPKTVIDSNIRV